MIIAFCGKMGSGKTLSMTYFARMMQERGRDIISNYTLNFKHRLISKKEIQEYGKTKGASLKDVMMLIDEAQTMLDCRQHQKNRIITYFILQTRKRGCDLAYTSQQFANVEKRLRENTDLIFECNPVKNKKGELEYIQLTHFNYHGRDTFSANAVTYLKVTPELFKLYDSYEIIDYDTE